MNSTCPCGSVSPAQRILGRFALALVTRVEAAGLDHDAHQAAAQALHDFCRSAMAAFSDLPPHPGGELVPAWDVPGLEAPPAIGFEAVGAPFAPDLTNLRQVAEWLVDALDPAADIVACATETELAWLGAAALELLVRAELAARG